MSVHTPTTVATALLVEDDERLARLTREYLEDHGVAVTWCGDGKHGLEVLKELRGRSDVLVPRRAVIAT